MADNITLNSGSSGAVLRTQDVTSVHYPVGLVAWGVDGGPYTEADDASGAGLPIQPDAGAVFKVSDNSGSLTVDAPVGTPVFVRLSDGSAAITTLPVSAASLPLPSGAATSAKQPALGTAGTASADVLTVQGIASMTALKVDGSAVTQPVSDGGGSLTVDNGGTFAVQAAQSGTWNVGTVTTVTTCSTVSTLTGGGVAHDAADSGNPVKVGVKATTSAAGLTLVANGDRTDLYAGSDGILIVRPECSLEDVVQERTTNTDGASTAFASSLAAPGAGVRLWVKSVTVCNSSASYCTVDLRDGSSGSVLWTLPVPATGGVTHVFDPPLKLTANTALAFDASAATTTLTISANGFKSKV